MSSSTGSRRHASRYATLGGGVALAAVILAVALAGGGGPSKPRPARLGPIRSSGLVPDPESARSFPQPANAPVHASALTPSQAALQTSVSPGAPSDAQVKAQLLQMERLQRAQRNGAPMGALDPASGTVIPPSGLPGVLKQVVAGANAIAVFPYRFGGGHASFVDNAYDCSGSLSYALAAGGMVDTPLTSGDLERWGVPGPGRYLTVYANAGHTFMYLNGLRYDTSGRDGPYGSRWQTAGRSVAGFVVRHWPGL